MYKITKVLIKSFITNISLALVKIISGFAGSSSALIADGIHSLSDTITDLFAMIGHKLSTKPADKKHPYGHGMIEYITCIGIGFVVMIMGFTIIYNGLTTTPIIPSALSIIITIIVIIIKLMLAKYILIKGHKYHSNILIASGKESFSDVISSIIVLISILISQLGYIYSWFMYADILATIIIGILILKIAYNIFKENFSSLLGEQITDENYLQPIKNIILKENQVTGIDTLTILKYGPLYHLTCEITMDKSIKLQDVHDILDSIESHIKTYDNKIDKIIIHVSPKNS